MKSTLHVLVIALLFTVSTFSQGTSSCWREVSAGQNFTLAIKADGTLWGWGQNGNLLGLGYFSVSENLPIQIGTANDWMTVSAGGNHALAVKTNGTLWSWGSGIFGQLGNGAFNSATFNVTQIGTATDWIKVSAGSLFSVALKNNGTLWTWGRNNVGQLGNNTFIDTNVPAQVGTAIDWSQIDAGGEHTLAIKTTGDLWAWGNNPFGQLGDGTTNTSNNPIIISTAGWSAVSAGFDHSMALTPNGLLYTWGNNTNGQLCNGTNTAVNIPTLVVDTSGAINFYLVISAGQTHSMVIRNDNTLWTSGQNNFGQLGIGNNSNTNVLNQVGTGTNWQLISAGYVHSHAMEIGANLWSAGRGLEGQLGVGSNTNSNIIVMVGCPATLSNTEVIAEINEVNVYPNPTSDLVNINYSLENSEKVSVTVTTIQGQTITELKMDKSSGVHSDSIDLSNQSSGMYFITITTETSSFTSKVIKR
jgi:alpha-tubulin suppressor-like RCC1 family protein